MRAPGPRRSLLVGLLAAGVGGCLLDIEDRSIRISMPVPCDPPSADCVFPAQDAADGVAVSVVGPFAYYLGDLLVGTESDAGPLKFRMDATLQAMRVDTATPGASFAGIDALELWIVPDGFIGIPSREAGCTPFATYRRGAQDAADTALMLEPTGEGDASEPLLLDAVVHGLGPTVDWTGTLTSDVRLEASLKP